MTLDATVGGPLSDSYLSVAAADELASVDLGPAAGRWRAPDVTVAMRERALLRATREIDAYLQSSGIQYSSGQSLLYPRAVDTASSLVIASSSVADPTEIRTTIPHGFSSGQVVTISGHASTPALDGAHTITVTGEHTFTVPVAVTVAATGGTLTNASVPTVPYLLPGIRHATYAQAKHLLAGGADMADATAMRAARGMTNASEPNISYTQDMGLDAPYLSNEARAHLRGAVSGRAATVKSVRLQTDYSPSGTEVLA